MNKWNRLLAALDQVYGFADQSKSSMKKLRQVFDEKANEHVIILEYRVMKTESSKPAQKTTKEEGEERRARKRDLSQLIEDVFQEMMLDENFRASNSSDKASDDRNYHRNNRPGQQ